MGKSALLIVFVFVTGRLVAQLETSQWYFGGHAGLDFSSSPPTVISNTNLNTAGGMTSMADANGNLLFYTDGQAVWNRLHQVMTNGTGLTTDPTAPQNVVVTVDLVNNNLYHVWTVDPLVYSTIDMSQSAGLGAVTAKSNTILLSSWNPGSIVVTTSLCGGQHLANSQIGSNKVLYSVNVVPSSTVPTFFTGIGYNHTALSYTPNWLKTSIFGMHIGVVARNDSTPPGDHEVTVIGKLVQNDTIWTINLHKGTALGDLFSCEFSPDGTKFYVSSPGTHHIYQWDLCAGSYSSIINSLYTISTGTTSVYGLQLAPDGKLYGASNPSLSVINHPNLAGAACGFTAQQQSIGTASCGMALPNFSSHYFQEPLGPVLFDASVDTVGCKSASFSVSSPSSYSNCPASREGISAVKWNFGDVISGAANTSTLNNPIHQFSGPGTYTVQLIVERGCYSDTLTKQVTVPGPWPYVSLAGNFSICANQSASITASGTDSYTWSGNSTGSVLIVSPTITTSYTLIGKNKSSGCEQVSSFTIDVWPCTSVKEINAERQISLQVMPAGDELLLRIHGADDHRLPENCRGVVLKDLSGRTLIRVTPWWQENSAVLNVSQIPAGVYFLSMENCGVAPVRFVLAR